MVRRYKTKEVEAKDDHRVEASQSGAEAAWVATEQPVQRATPADTND
jgi:hypothetical protein